MKPTKSDCGGCIDDFYNDHNPYGVKECWHFKSAKIVKRVRVGIDERPPYKHHRPQPMMDCRTEKGYALVDPSRIAKDGYWNV